MVALKRHAESGREIVKIASTVFAALIAATTIAGCNAPSRPRAILLVSIDTTRPDRLSAYGYERPTTPGLRRLARAGVRFESAYTSMPTTDPSHATMLTGVYPSVHGVQRNGQSMFDPTIETLASWLGRRGYTTGAVTARAHLNPTEIGLRGFDFSDPPQPPALTRTADQVLARVQTHIASMSKKDWFLWVHLWEPHAPYDPPASQRQRFYSGGFNRLGRPPRLLRKPPTLIGKRRVAETSIQRIGELYDAELATADAALDRLVRIAADNAPGGSIPLIVVVSDHGEELGERQASTGVGFGHGTLLYEEVVRVAWVLSRPGVIPSAVLHTPVSLVDLAATVSSLVDVNSPLLGEGRSLASAVLAGREPKARPVIIERRSFSSLARLGFHARQWARLHGNWKLIYTEAAGEVSGSSAGEADKGGGAGKGEAGVELYDLSTDPRERSNRAEAEPERGARMLSELQAWIMREATAEKRADRRAGRSPLDRHKLKDLRALGYID